MNKAEILEALKEILSAIKPKLDLTNITDDSSLLGDLGIDSLSMLMLSLAAEKKFGVEFDTQAQLKTVGDVLNYISERKNA